MSIDDIDVMWQVLPDVFDTREVPGSWGEEWSFGTASETWVDHIVSDIPTRESTVAPRGGRQPWTGPALTGQLTFGGAPVPRDPSQQVPPPDALGFYLPFHHFYPDWWGIYIIAEGVSELADWLRTTGEGQLSVATSVGLAYRFIYWHEAFHHQVEAFASRLEVTHRKPVYRLGVRDVGARLVPPDPTEESLASGFAFQKCDAWLRDTSGERDVGLKTLYEYIERQPPPYDSAREFVYPPEWMNGRDWFAEQVQREARPDLPRLSSELWRMFSHAFTGFVRSGSRVHYMVRRDSPLHHRLSSHGLFLRYREVARRLRALDCRELRAGRGSHVVWVAPNGNQTTVPVHGRRDLAPGTLRHLLRQLGIHLPLSQFGGAAR